MTLGALGLEDFGALFDATFRDVGHLVSRRNSLCLPAARMQINSRVEKQRRKEGCEEIGEWRINANWRK